MQGPALRSYLFLSWWHSGENQYCMLAKENFSLNLVQKKMSGALPSLVHAASSQILGISVQGEPSGQGCWTEGGVRGERPLWRCRYNPYYLVWAHKPDSCGNRTLISSPRCKRPKQPFSSLMLQSKLQTLHSWSWAMCRAIRKSKLCQSKMQPLLLLLVIS